MPVAIPFIIGAIAAAGAVAAGVAIGTALLVGSLVAVGMSLMSKPSSGVDSPQVPPAAYQTDPTTLSFSSEAPRRLVYGKPRVSGVVVYANVGGGDNEDLYMVVAIAAHQISSVDAIWIDGVSGDTFGSKLQWWWHAGTDDQTADASLMATFSQWTAQHRLQGIAYAVVKMIYDKTVWKTGAPKNIQFDIKGKPVYDPRTGVTSWSRNVALNMYDYMRSPFGLGADASEFSLDHVIRAANVCDEIPSGASSSVCDGRYCCEGVVELSAQRSTVLDTFVAAMAGALVHSEGIYMMFAGTRSPVVGQINQSMLVKPPTIVPQTATDQTFNTVRGKFLDSGSGWVYTDFPQVSGAAYVEEDGEELTKDITFQLTTSPILAQRLATIFLRRERLDESITLECDWQPYNFQVWDVIELSLPIIGYVNKQFQITRWSFRLPSSSDPGGVSLSLREYSDDLYSDDMDLLPETGGGIIEVPDTNTIRPVTGVTMLSDLTTIDTTDGAPGVMASWLMHTSPYCVGYEVIIRLVGSSEMLWVAIPSRTITSYWVRAELDQRYEVLIRAVNSRDVRSATTVGGPVTASAAGGYPPEDVPFLDAAIQPGGLLTLSWGASAQARWYSLKFVPDGTTVPLNVAFLDAPNQTTLVSRQSVDGVWLAYAVNSAGVESLIPAEAFSPGYSSSFPTYIEVTRLDHLILDNMLRWGDGSKLIPNSTVLASAYGWELFDLPVPNPVAACAAWSAPRYVATAKAFAPVGAIGWTAMQPTPSGLFSILPTGNDGEASYTIQWLTDDNVFVKVGLSYLPNTQMAFIIGVNLRLEDRT